ncbi:MAG: hemerythrin domain-containing protein [Chloroflexi bacterium]|nr:hemerythrin domain-containing protein [Chloroflexota bacterium]
MEFNIPQPLKLEHDELHVDLARATGVGGKVGEAAEAVAQILHPHFLKEEEFALPPLGLLSLLTKGDVTPEMGEVLAMTDRLKAEFPQMIDEHKAIVTALKNMSDVATKENKPEYARFAEKLILHAQTEEEVFYHTTLLIGEYVKLKLNR